MKLYIVIISYLIMNSLNSQTSYQNIKIVYIGDPMCSWCYGISEELSLVKEHFKNQLDFELIVGGLRPGGGDEWNVTFKNFLIEHWKEVNAKSGVPFSFDLFKQDYFLYDTEPSCRAVVVIKDINKDKAIDFFKAIQKGFYFENKDPKEVSFYKSICLDLSIDFEDFKSKFESEKYKSLTTQEFQYAMKIGARSFPTVMLQKNGTLYKVASGFSKSSKMIENIQELINN